VFVVLELSGEKPAEERLLSNGSANTQRRLPQLIEAWRAAGGIMLR